MMAQLRIFLEMLGQIIQMARFILILGYVLVITTMQIIHIISVLMAFLAVIIL